MKISSLFLALLGLTLCSCDHSSKNNPAEANDGTPLISIEETRRVAMHVLLNRYPKAEIVSESGDGQTWTYRFATNGTTVPVAVVVDRKAAKARFESLRR